MLYFDDFEPGQIRRFEGDEVSEADIIAFASRFDAQDFHVDPVAAKASFAGELTGAGWHTCCLLMRMIADGFLLEAASMGSPGIEEVKWLNPLRPGDRLTAVVTVIETRASRSKPDRGVVRFRFDVLNASGDVLLEQTNWIMFGKRGMGAPVAPQIGSGYPLHYRPPATLSLPEPPLSPVTPRSWLDDLVVGERTELGSYTFTADEITAFARSFDPQPFHTDSAAARLSSFGGLVASGWHTASVWMMLMIAHRDRQLAARPETSGPRLGPSPGFRNLKWLKPVHAGDTLTYASEITQTRASASRPGWGLVFTRNTGMSQNGDLAFQFDGCVFWERRADVG